MNINQYPTFDHLILKKHEIDLIIYHDNCTDGYTGAFAAYLYFESIGKKDIIYIGASHLNNININVKNKNVCMIDFSYKKDILLDLIKDANKLIILDHHKTAEEDLFSIPDKNKVFKMNYSGAFLAWLYFIYDDNNVIPDLIHYVQDNDLWTKKLANTNEYSNYIHFYLRNIKSFDELKLLLNNDYLKDKALTIGSTIMEINEININNAVNNSVCKYTKINDKYYFVGYCNSQILKSEIGNRIFNKYDKADFTAVYNIDDKNNRTIFSLRSLNDKEDVSYISKLFGGGGHRNASGLTLDFITNILPNNINDNNINYNNNNNELYDIIYSTPNLHVQNNNLNIFNNPINKYNKLIHDIIFKTISISIPKFDQYVKYEKQISQYLFNKYDCDIIYVNVPYSECTKYFISLNQLLSNENIKIISEYYKSSVNINFFGSKNKYTINFVINNNFIPYSNI